MSALLPEDLPAARAEMRIRRPVPAVFDAFIDPALTSRFWFTSGSDRLDAGVPVRWTWEMYGVSTEVQVLDLQPNRRIFVRWSADEPPATVEWTFTALPDDTTFVSIVNAGFRGSPREIAEQLIAATEGFTLVLAGAKAFLEHGLELHLVADRFPQGMAG